MSVERRGQVIRALITLVNWQQEEPTDCGEGRQPLMDGTSRVSREAQARFCEGLGVQLPGATRPATGSCQFSVGFLSMCSMMSVSADGLSNRVSGQAAAAIEFSVTTVGSCFP